MFSILNSVFIKDVFRDSTNNKFSLSRVLATILFFVVVLIHIIAIKIMIARNEIDHALLVEDFTFIGTIVIGKNYLNRNNVEIKSVKEEPKVENPTA